MSAQADYPTTEQCPDCWRQLDPPSRCPCSFGPEPFDPARPWRVFRESSYGVPFASEMMARAYVTKFGGTLKHGERVVGAWPTPSWYRKLIAEGVEAAKTLRERRSLEGK